ncbi:hypothetical protein N1851_029776 [Merluccius polli]|uniref:Uncharacterized protein n=1 Tax=Merluccius polli TaxID=89951 RepID=A0AA47M6J9_MERPO|nr:hypothetical protein N1851_029776 [Merluccius polli]
MNAVTYFEIQKAYLHPAIMDLYHIARDQTSWPMFSSNRKMGSGNTYWVIAGYRDLQLCRNGTARFQTGYDRDPEPRLRCGGDDAPHLGGQNSQSSIISLTSGILPKSDKRTVTPHTLPSTQPPDPPFRAKGKTSSILLPSICYCNLLAHLPDTAQNV